MQIPRTSVLIDTNSTLKIEGFLTILENLLKLIQCQIGRFQIDLERINKMNKTEIKELVDLFQLTAESAKSCANRFEASLGKTGSASSRLSMVGSSILKLAETANEEDVPTLEAIGNLAKFFSSVAVDNKKTADASAPAKKRKTGWENLKDADATPAKPKKSKSVEISGLDNEQIIAQLLQALSVGR